MELNMTAEFAEALSTKGPLSFVLVNNLVRLGQTSPHSLIQKGEIATAAGEIALSQKCLYVVRKKEESLDLTEPAPMSFFEELRALFGATRISDIDF